MAFDSDYMLGPNLQDFLIDAQTGLPMTDGTVFFFSDINRNVPKSVFTIAGNAQNYSFTDIGATVQLSSVGTTTDNNGNDIKIYYYPFDADGNVENYFVQVYDEQGNLEFTRENWPGLASGTETAIDLTNYVPNGQFLFHDNNTGALSITQGANGAMTVVTAFMGYGTSIDIWQIAPGGWTYERTHNSTATDTITFPNYGAFVDDPLNSPRYSVQINRTLASSDTVSDLRLKFMDVNKFQETVQYFYFNVDSIAGPLNNINIEIVQYFGSGGSPSAAVTTIIETVSVLANTPTAFVIPIDFTQLSLLTAGKSIGTNNDDYVQIAINLPGTIGNTYNVQFTDFVLTPTFINAGSLILPQTNGSFLEGALFNTAQTSNAESSQYYAEDGSQYYLPMVMTSSGMTYDYSQIGTVVAKITATATNNELLMDGSMYVTSAYSALGIPYARLQKVLWNSTYNAPIFGTGANFVNSFATAASSGATILLSTNKLGAQTLPALGTTSPGFTLNTTSNLGVASNYGYRVFANSTGVINAISTFTNGTNGGNAFAAGTSTMVFNNWSTTINQGIYYGVYFTALTASALAAGAATPGLYFTFSSHTVNYYLWFKVSTETDPAPGGTGIACNLTSGMSAVDVANVIANVMNGFQTTTITTVMASTPIPNQSWFTFNANAVQYAVWYQVNSSSSAPVISGSPILIQVTLTGTETAAQVATKTQIAINSYSYSVGDARGMFLRGADPNSEWDLDLASRWTMINYLNAASPGSFEFNQFTSHTHAAWNQNGAQLSSSGHVLSQIDVSQGQSLLPGYAGGTETRPVNMYVNFFIKY